MQIRRMDIGMSTKKGRMHFCIRPQSIVYMNTL